MTKRKAAIIADIDNTLYNFVDFFAPAFRAMLHTLAGKTRIPEEELVESFRTVYSKYRSLEYPFSVQELQVLRSGKYGQFDIDQLRHAAWVAFSRSRNLRLRPYPLVTETLAWLKSNGYLMIAYTDAPYGHSKGRLTNLGIKPYFDLLIAWGPTTGEVPGEETYHEDAARWFGDLGGASSDSNLLTRIVGSSERKPNKILLRSIAEELNIDPARSFVVGDSLVKDLVPAREAGFNDVWASYGKEYAEKNWQTLREISPWHESVVKKESESMPCFEPTHVIQSFADLRRLVPVVQLELFDNQDWYTFRQSL